jgi:hypothetical protein
MMMPEQGVAGPGDSSKSILEFSGLGNAFIRRMTDFSDLRRPMLSGVYGGSDND